MNLTVEWVVPSLLSELDENVRAEPSLYVPVIRVATLRVWLEKELEVEHSSYGCAAIRRLLAQLPAG